MQKLKQIIFLSFAITYLLNKSTFAQSINNYIFNTNTNASMLRSFGSLLNDVDMTTGTSLLIGGSQATQNTAQLPIGFDFWANGQRFTTFNVTANGWVGIGTSALSTTGWLTNLTTGVRLAPFLGPIITSSPILGTIGTSAIGRVHYKTIGSTPNRICVIEFLRMAINTSVVDDTNTFQVRLYERTGAIEYVYGRMKVSAGAPITYNVGFQFPTTLFHSVNVSANTNSTSVSTNNTYSTNDFITNLHGNTPGNQRMYRWQSTLPSTPTNLTFSNVTSNSVTLNWNDVTDDFGYAVYVSTDGGLTYNWALNTATNITTANITNLPPNTLVYFRVHARREALGDALDGSTPTLPLTVISSVKDGNWNDPTVWSTNSVPTVSDSVVISAGDTVIINISALGVQNIEINGTLLFGNVTSNFTINRNLVINNTGIFSAGSSTFTHNLILGGSTTNVTSAGIVNNGVLDFFTTATVNTQFLGTLDASVTGNGFFEFVNIIIQKGNNANVLLNGTLEIFSTINIVPPPNQTTNRISLNSGTLKISGANNLTPYPGSGFTLCNTNARLWINHPNANIFSDISTSPTTLFTIQALGHLLITNGNLVIGSGNHLVNTNSATKIELNNGILRINGSLTINNFSTCSLTVTGGNLIIDPQVNANRTNQPALNINSSSYFNMTGGNIIITDPVFTNNVNSINIPTNSNKTISGGNIILGIDTTTDTSTGGIATAGFGINSAVPFFNLVINNRTDISNTRQVRLTSNISVLNNLTIQPNGYLFLGSGSEARKLTINNNLVNNGILAGTWNTGTLSIGELSFENNGSTITVSGNGNLLNFNEITINNTGSSVVFNNTANWVVNRVNLLSGTFIQGSNFTIGSNTIAPIIQIGGVDQSTPSGTFFSLPNINTTFGLPSYIYSSSSGTPTTGASNEMPSGTLNALKLIINDENGLNTNRNINIRDSLVLNNGSLNLGSNNLTLGVSNTIPGRILSNNNFINITTGTITRWYATSQVVLNNSDNGFPIAVAGLNRSVLINSQGVPLNVGGTISVNHENANLFVDLNTPFVDDLVNVNRRTISSWTLGMNNIVASSGIVVSLTGQGIGSINNVNNLRMIRANDANAGTNINGTGTPGMPIVSRSFNSSSLSQINNTFYIGSNSSENPLEPVFTAIANGNWNNPFTWNTIQVPTINNAVVIPSGITVTHNTNTNIFCDSLTLDGTLNFSGDTFTVNKGIRVTGNLNISAGNTIINGSTQNGLTVLNNGNYNHSGGNLRLGETGGSNKTFTVNGLFAFTSGNIEVNGNLLINSTAAFNQSGGNLIIDGNSGSAATSVPPGIHHVVINSDNVNCSAGSITIIDPPHSSYTSGSTQTLRITANSSLTSFTGNHTFIFGDGISNTPGNANGFNIDNRRNGIVPLQNIIINAGNGSGRWVSPSFSSGSFGMYVKGNITVQTNSELRHTTPSQLVIGGNIINNGIITAAQLITFGGLGYIINTPQNISGSGIFRNNTTSPTANIASATLDNSGGLNIANASATISISNTLNLTNGVLNMGNNILKMNQGSVLNRTNGFVIGNINRWINSGTNVNVIFPIGVGNTYTPFTVNFPSITSAGELVLNNTNTDHPQISSSCIDAAKSVNRYWSLFGIGFGPLVNYSVSINFASSEIDLGSNTANFKLQYYNTTNWTTANLVSVSSNNISANGINGAGEFQIGEFVSVNASITISASSTNICLGSNVIFTATPVNGGSSPIFQWRKNGNIVGSNSNTYNDNTLNNGDQITCSLTSSLPCGAGNPVSSNTITMQVSAPTVKGTVSPNQQICVGNSPSQLNLSGNNGGVIRWEFATSPFTTWNIINHTSTTYQPGAISQTTAFRAIVQNGGCAAMASDSAIITVLSSPVGGTVSGSSTICSGSIAPTLTLSGHSGGSIIRWESSIFPFFVWNPIANTTTTLNPGVLSITTRFRAVISNGTCNPVFSNDAIINIQQPGTWLGLVSSDWTNPSNWCGGVPGTTTNVTITSGTPFAPVINGNVNCNDLVLNNNATLSFAGTTNTLNIHGDAFISNSATFNTNNGTVNFASNNYQLIPAINFHHLSISGGGFKEIAGNILVNNTLTLNNGLIQLNNSNLTIGNNGSINGGSSSSYIVTNNFGKLIQNNIGNGGKTGLIFYPVGSNTFSYTPIYILNSGAADNYGVGIIEGVYNSYSGETPNGMSILNNVVDKTFVINESVSGGSNLSILMQWNGANELSGFNRANCYASRYMVGGWNPFSATSASGSNPYSILVSGITNTGLFGIASNGALPVSWISFFGNKKGNNIELKWQTASEKNNKGFYVERSVNGNDFEIIGFVNGNNNSNVVADYSYTDLNASHLYISNPEISKLFYRLKQVDIDGSQDYSNTISVDLIQQSNGEEFYVYPNPFTDAITINNYQNENEKVVLSIADINGKILLKETLFLNNGSATLNNISTLPSGVYIINIDKNGNLHHKKLIKQ